jgi:PST family polysaccharide transporter
MKTVLATEQAFAAEPLPFEGGLGGVAAVGFFWNIGFAALNKVFTLAGQVALAWLLLPADVGLAGMATAIAGFAAFLAPSVLTNVLVQRNRYHQEAGQALWLAVALGTAGAGVIGCLALLSSRFGRGELHGLLWVLALGALLSGPGAVLGARLKLNLDFKHLAMAHGLQGLVFTAGALVLAWFHFGPYALVLPLIPGTLVATAYILWREGWPVWQAPRPAVMGQLLRPMGALALSGSLNTLQAQAPVFMVGLILSASATGHYAWGWMVAGQAAFLLAANLRHVLLPVFARLSQDPQRQAAAAFKSARAMTAVLSLACGAQALLAGPLILAFLPAQWAPAIPVVRWVSLGLALQGLTVSAGAWLNAVGRYRSLVWVSAAAVALVAGLAWGGAWAGGAEGAAIGSALGTAAGALLFFACLPLRGRGAELFKSASTLAGTGLLWGLMDRLLPPSMPWTGLIGSTLAFLALGAGLWLSQDRELWGLWRRWKK